MAQSIKIISVIILALLGLSGCWESIAEAKKRAWYQPDHLPTPTRPIPVPVLGQDLFSKGVCAAPCWMGIIPGKTNSAALSKAIKTLPLDKEKYQNNWSIQAHFSGSVNLPLNNSGYVFIQLDQGIVSSIRINDPDNANLIVEEVLKNWGTPEWVVPNTDNEVVDCPPDEMLEREYIDKTSLWSLLLYPSSGITVKIRVPEVFSGCIRPGMKINEFIFYPPDSFEKAIHDPADRMMGGIRVSPFQVSPWYGFGPGYFSSEPHR